MSERRWSTTRAVVERPVDHCGDDFVSTATALIFAFCKTNQIWGRQVKGVTSPKPILVICAIFRRIELNNLCAQILRNRQLKFAKTNI